MPSRTLERMGWLVRFVVSSATLIGGCAALAGIDDGPTASDAPTLDPNDTGTGTSPVTEGGPGGGGRDTGTSMIVDTGTATDTSTAADAPPDAPACTKKQNDETCSQGSECCSTKCNEQRRCKNSCKPLEDTCGYLSTSECCVGLYCSTQTSGFPPNFRCKTCIPNGQAPEAAPVTGTLLDYTCCSRNIESGLCADD